jgi:hypothetical protein
MSRELHAYHEDGDLFREALSYTQSETGFSARLVEKDYYCSLLLEDMAAVTRPPWVFKGGTCLSKVHKLSMPRHGTRIKRNTNRPQPPCLQR